MLEKSEALNKKDIHYKSTGCVMSNTPSDSMTYLFSIGEYDIFSAPSDIFSSNQNPKYHNLIALSSKIKGKDAVIIPDDIINTIKGIHTDIEDSVTYINLVATYCIMQYNTTNKEKCKSLLEFLNDFSIIHYGNGRLISLMDSLMKVASNRVGNNPLFFYTEY